MPYPRWRGAGNSATRRRIERIRWTRRDKIGAMLLGALMFLTVVFSGWLGHNYGD
jgi:hypothetical protein